jgi:uncharacterized membrane protein YebE (DUF533 family)
MSPQAGSLLQDQIVPRLQSAIPYAVNPVGSEDAQELIQDGTALAAMIMHNAEKNGKKVTRSATGKPGQITAGNIAYYAIVKLRNGCRSNGIVTGFGGQVN